MSVHRQAASSATILGCTESTSTFSDCADAEAQAIINELKIDNNIVLHISLNLFDAGNH